MVAPVALIWSNWACVKVEQHAHVENGLYVRFGFVQLVDGRLVKDLTPPSFWIFSKTSMVAPVALIWSN